MPKVRILEEYDHPIVEQAPPNFLPWMECWECFDRLSSRQNSTTQDKLQ